MDLDQSFSSGSLLWGTRFWWDLLIKWSRWGDFPSILHWENLGELRLLGRGVSSLGIYCWGKWILGILCLSWGILDPGEHRKYLNIYSILADIISRQTFFSHVYLFVCFSFFSCVLSPPDNRGIFSLSCLKWFILDTFSVFFPDDEATRFFFLNNIMYVHILTGCGNASWELFAEWYQRVLGFCLTLCKHCVLVNDTQ